MIVLAPRPATPPGRRGRLVGGFGEGFGRLWLAQGLSNLGDGMTLAAAPLLLTTLTHSAVLIGGVAGVQQLPTLLFGLVGGAVVAGVVLVVFGVHDGVWTVVTSTARQQLIPEHMRGRIQSAYLTFAVGGHAIGAFLGGALVALGGARAPLWFALAVMAPLSAAVAPYFWSADWPVDGRTAAAV